MTESTHENQRWHFRILQEAHNAIESLELEERSLTEAETSKAEQISWLLPKCREAVEDVKYFWRYWRTYSKDPKPSYLQAAVFLFSGRSSESRSIEVIAASIIHNIMPKILDDTKHR